MKKSYFLPRSYSLSIIVSCFGFFHVMINVNAHDTAAPIITPVEGSSSSVPTPSNLSVYAPMDAPLYAPTGCLTDVSPPVDAPVTIDPVQPQIGQIESLGNFAGYLNALNSGISCPKVPRGGCAICGKGKCISKPEAALGSVPDEQLHSVWPSTCGKLQENALNGKISAEQCPIVSEYIDACGCIDAPDTELFAFFKAMRLPLITAAIILFILIIIMVYIFFFLLRERAQKEQQDYEESGLTRLRSSELVTEKEKRDQQNTRVEEKYNIVEVSTSRNVELSDSQKAELSLSIKEEGKEAEMHISQFFSDLENPRSAEGGLVEIDEDEFESSSRAALKDKKRQLEQKFLTRFPENSIWGSTETVQYIIPQRRHSTNREKEKIEGEEKRENIYYGLDYAALFFFLSCHGSIFGLILGDKSEIVAYILLVIPGFAMLAILIFLITKLRAKNDIFECSASDCREIQLSIEYNDIYEDFTSPALRSIMLGIAQCILAFLYLDAIYLKLKDIKQIEILSECEDDYFGCAVSHLFKVYYWLGSIVVTGYVCGNEIWRTPVRSFRFWLLILKIEIAKLNNKKWKIPEYHQYSRISTSNINMRRLQLLIRFIGSLVVNSTALLFITIALPIQVAFEEKDFTKTNSLEFILNVVGAFFITEIDNLWVPRRYKLKCVKIGEREKKLTGMGGAFDAV